MNVPCPERISKAVRTHCIHSLFDRPWRRGEERESVGVSRDTHTHWPHAGHMTAITCHYMVMKPVVSFPYTCEVLE